MEHFVDECDSRLSLRIATTGEDDLKDLTPEEKMVKVIGWRLDMLKEHAEHWGAALAVMGLPENLPTTLRQRAMLADELVGATGPTMTGLDSSKGGNITAAAKAAGFYGDRAAAGALSPPASSSSSPTPLPGLRTQTTSSGRGHARCSISPAAWSRLGDSRCAT